MGRQFLDSDGKVLRQTFLGCDLQSVSFSSSVKNPGNINIVLTCGPDQTFDLAGAAVDSILGSGTTLILGDMTLSGTLQSWEETTVSINGTNIINVKLVESITRSEIIFESGILNFSELLAAHSEEIISVKQGWELRQSRVNFEEFLFNFEEAVAERSILSIIDIEAAGLPKSNPSRLFFEDFDSFLNKNFPFIQSLRDRLEDPNISDQERLFLINEITIRLSAAYSFFSRSFPKRSDGPRQIQVQFSPQGIKTRYSFNPPRSNIDQQLEEIYRTLDYLRQTVAKNTPRRKFLCDELNSRAELLLDLDCSSSPDELDRHDEVIDDVLGELGSLASLGAAIDFAQLEGGAGVVTGKTLSTGPYYEVRRLASVDIDPQSFAGRITLPIGWSRVRNLAEPDNSFGYLLPGTQVTVEIFRPNESSQGTPFMEQTPQTFAPPGSE
jgi:hypothetical protein